MIRFICGLALLLLAVAPAWSQDKNSPDAALEQLLKEARENCAQPTDRLSKVLCGGRIRIGVRDYYPLFSTREGDERSGYEVDVAHAIAKRFGVEADFHRVNAATRIPMIGEDRIDLVIATMGHNTQRDSQVRFIRPHYYQSETTVVGPKSLPIKGWKDVSGRTICVTVGNVSNAVIVSENVRLMLFDEAGVLPERLRDETCVLPALNAELKPTPFAESVLAFEAWVERRLGLDVTLPMLTIAPAFTMFLDGVVNSLILIAGALIATLAFALVFGAAAGSSSRLPRWSARAITVILQSSPIVLTLVIAAALAQAIFPYSSSVAIGAAILALGLTNGSNAGQAISEAMTSLRGAQHLSGMNLFLHSLGRSATQIVAFLVNAAKGTPVASFIGAPELLSALTDITSFSSGRVTTYCLLLIFYTVVVMGVVWLCNRLRSFLEHNEATA